MLDSKIIKGYILLKSGLHIGGSDAGIHIGGIDNPVIKNPLTGYPYIPGSSFKGKMRFLLEHAYSVVDSKGFGDIPEYSDKNNIIPVIFGHLGHKNYTTFPTRVIFRDCQIIGAITEFMKENLDEKDILRDLNAIREMMGSEFVEGKTEVAIDRLSGTVGKSGPRTIERVSAGTVFEFEISLRGFVDHEINKHLDIIKQGLKLVENDALGGSGSRGSGKVKFFGLKVNNESFEL